MATPNRRKSSCLNRWMRVVRRVVLTAALGAAAVHNSPSFVLAAPPEEGVATRESPGSESRPNAGPDIQRLIDELGNEEYTVRKKAFEQLLAAGMPAREPLLALADGPDPETRASARRLVTL